MVLTRFKISPPERAEDARIWNSKYKTSYALPKPDMDGWYYLVDGEGLYFPSPLKGRGQGGV